MNNNEYPFGPGANVNIGMMGVANGNGGIGIYAEANGNGSVGAMSIIDSEVQPLWTQLRSEIQKSNSSKSIVKTLIEKLSATMNGAMLLMNLKDLILSKFPDFQHLFSRFGA